MMNELERRLALAVAANAARRAGTLLMDAYERIDRERLTRKSSGRDLVTEADLASERLLVAELRAALAASGLAGPGQEGGTAFA